MTRQEKSVAVGLGIAAGIWWLLGRAGIVGTAGYPYMGQAGGAGPGQTGSGGRGPGQ